MAQSVGQVALDIVVGKNEVTGTNGVLSKLGGVASGVGKAVGAGLAVAGGAVLAIGKQAVSSYGEYEQLVGGVETLFKESADTVIENASRAYTSAGMSANEYMQTVTSFSASLLQSLGGDTVEASKKADMAITDMADNANKMGTSIEMIQNAYQGFAKQNYTMLDNLKLGYGGTKTEMERLLEDATAISGIDYDIESYADVVDAIHVIQNEMGITGTTAKEASQTIQGSLSAMGASWQNLLTGLTDPTQDFDKLVNNFVDSIGAVAENLIPRLTNVMSGVVNLVTQLAPVIVDEVPKLIQAVLPSLLEGAISIVNAVVGALPSLIGMIVEMLPTLIPLLVTGLVSMIVALCSNMSQIIQPIIDNLPLICTTTVNALMENLPLLLQGLIDLTIALVGAFGQVLGMILAPIGEWIYNHVIVPVANFFSGMWSGASAGAESAWEKIKTFLAPVGEFFQNLWDEITEMATLAWDAIKAVWDVVAPWFQAIWEGIKSIFSVAWEAIKGYFAIAWEVLKGIWDVAVHYFTLIWENIKAVFSVVVDVLGGYFSTAWANIKVIWDVVVSYFKTLWDNIKLTFSVVKDFFTGNFKGAWEGVKAIFANWGAFFSNLWDGVKNIFKNVGTFFSSAFSSAWDGIKKIFSNFSTFFSNIWNSIKNIFKNVGATIGNAITNTVKTAINGVLSTAVKIINGFISAINFAIRVINAIPGVKIAELSALAVPQLEQGGVLKKGQVGLLEGKGAEAVVPLERNTGWLTKIADMLNERIGFDGLASAISGAVSAPALHNVRASTAYMEQNDGRLDRLIELFELFLSEREGDMTVPIYIGNELVNEYIVNKNSRQKLRSGGHA